MPLTQDATVAECGVFDALPSLALVLTVTIASAFVLYILGYILRSCVGRPMRSASIFALDILKIAIAQAGGVALTAVLVGHSSAEKAHPGEFDQLSWYFSTSLFMETFCVLVALLIGFVLTSFFGLLGKRCGTTKLTGALHSFGRYSSDDAESQQLLGGERERGPKASWWFAQLLLWLACVAGGRVAGAYAVPALLGLGGQSSPGYLLARAVYQLKGTCAHKQLLTGALRIAVDFVLLFLVDHANRYSLGGRRGAANGGAGGPPLLTVGSRVRALWKYPAQYEDELTFEAGEVITIEGEVQGEELWFKGRIGNRTGLIPSNYVVEEGGTLGSRPR